MRLKIWKLCKYIVVAITQFSLLFLAKINAQNYTAQKNTIHQVITTLAT